MKFCNFLVGSFALAAGAEQIVNDDQGGSAGERPSTVKQFTRNETSDAFTCRSDCHDNSRCQSGCSNSAGGICCNTCGAGRPDCHSTTGCQSGCASNPGSDVCCSNTAKGDGESGTKELKKQALNDDQGGSAGERPSMVKQFTRNETSDAFTC